MDVLEQRRPDAVERAARVLGPVTRTGFRYTLRGMERIPDRPCLFVGNHSGAGVIEVLCMLPAWHGRFGESRPVLALANKVSLGYPVIGPWLRTVGAVPASRENGRALLARGRDLLVFPGGDIDSFRPFWQHRKVIFGKRRGYVRLALEMGVPIVPIATIGAHLTYLMAPGNEWLANRLGLKRRARLESAPVTLGLLGTILATGATALALVDPLVLLGTIVAAAVPIPVRITSEMLAPIDLAREIPASLSDHERVERGHELVFSALQERVRTMTHEG
jgi:1-acyl-sn-glycerol-3-phosphate acyltransferase